jgi:hypothetical protein
MRHSIKKPAQILKEVAEQRQLSQDGLIIYWEARNSGACHEDALDAVECMLGEKI